MKVRYILLITLITSLVIFSQGIVAISLVEHSFNETENESVGVVVSSPIQPNLNPTSHERSLERGKNAITTPASLISIPR